MATAAEIQVAYKAIYRTDLNATVAAAIANSGISVDAYIAQQLPQVAATTQAAVAIASFVTGTAPTSDKLDALKVAADAQVASYTALGSSNPQLGAYEAFGRSFATDSTTTAGFNTKYGALSTSDFIAVVYAQVYGTQPSAAAAANLTAQINYFTNLYTVNGVANAALAAKGAVLGQIVGYAFTSAASANSNLDNQVQSLLTSAAKGDTTVYNKALPTVVDPGAVGVTINITTVNDVVSPSAADPALKTTANNDIINSAAFAATNKIDGGAGDDTANLTVGALTIATGQLTNVETVVVTSGATEFNVEKATGIKTIGFLNNSADAGKISGIAAGTNLTYKDATGSNSVEFAFLDASGTADSAKLTVDGLDTKTKTITIAGIETLNVTTAGTAASSFTLVDAALKDLTLTTTKDLTIAGMATSTALETVTATGSANVVLEGNLGTALKSVDASGLTGSAGITFVTGTANSLTSVKGGAGADSVELTSTKAVAIDTGAGNDTIKYTTSNTAAGAVLGEVKSGAGNDKVTLISTGITTGTAATQKVTLGQGGDELTLTDTGNVSTTIIYTAASESTASFQDKITGFQGGVNAVATTNAADKIDISVLGLTSQTIVKATALAAVPTADTAGLFSGNATQIISYYDGTDTVLLIDANKDGNYSAGTDMSIKLAGFNYDNLNASNFVFSV